jgi:hypothetical protein
MYVTITAPDRVFSIGDGSPATHTHIDAPGVTLGTINADGRTDSEAASVNATIDRVGGVEALFFPPPVGAEVGIYRSDTGALIVSGVLASIDAKDKEIAIEVKL